MKKNVKTERQNAKEHMTRSLKSREKSAKPLLDEKKKQRHLSQNNRFTSVGELLNPSEAKDYYGSLLFDFSKDPVEIRISDISGNYELQVSNESLKDFKMRVLLGEDKRSKPNFTILLGDCQCYPELPEGALPLSEDEREKNANKEDEKLRFLFSRMSCDESTSEGTLAGTSKEENSKNDNSATKEAESLLMTDASNCVEENSVEDTDNAWSINKDFPKLSCKIFDQRNQEGSGGGDGMQTVNEETTNSLEDSLKAVTIEPRKSDFSKDCKKSQVSQCKRKQSHPHAVQKFRTVKRRENISAYKSNLEGFIKFLMYDDVCSSALNQTKSSHKSSTSVKSANECDVIRYSNGQNYIIAFQKNEVSSESQTKSGDLEASYNGPNSNDCTSCSASLKVEETLPLVIKEKDVESNESQLTMDKMSSGKSDFIQEVKRELIEWQASCGKTIEVAVINKEKSVCSLEESNSNVDTISEEQKTIKKADDEFHDATSTSDTGLLSEDSLEQFFLELKEKDHVEEEATEKKSQSSELHTSPRYVVFKEMKSEPPSESSNTHSTYVPPIPLNLLTDGEIEAMWLSFVKTFFPNSVELTTEKSQVSFKEEKPKIVPDLSVYPGQHSLPYFVERNLKRTNSDSSIVKPPCVSALLMNSFEGLRQHIGSFCPSYAPNVYSNHQELNRSEPDFPGMSPPSDWLRTNVPFQQKFLSQKSRIFFNPKVMTNNKFY